MEDWNGLRLVLAIAREGGLAGAARALRIDHSTVFRRLQALESALGTRLFDREPGGAYTPTEAGAQAAAAAERIEEEAHALDRAITGRDHRLTGLLRITSSETLAQRLLMPELVAFRRAHPAIALELVTGNRVLSLARREADVALRALRPEESELWGRKLCDAAWAIYRRDPAAEGGALSGGPDELGLHPLIGWGPGADGIRAAEWLHEHAPGAHVAFRSSSLMNQLAAAEAGLGLVILPCYLGDTTQALARAWPEPIFARELWMVTHEDLRGTARVRAFFEVVGEGLLRRRDLIEGREAGERAS